ncbi:hypothetical protein NQ317_003169 [Molorchus minor]|uniref:Alpha-endosulfine n=1 Tax=Molorchus minor TaxID=1323400 RepID=A0ABQ9JBV2_9CUCU|nr:hypothetical protein NQ317_003169 [Molorchus minor]
MVLEKDQDTLTEFAIRLKVELIYLKMSDQETEQPEQPQPELSLQEIEKQEEAKFKAKYAAAPGSRLMGGHSAFLQKRLAKGQKFFDSGDYQMAKQKMGGINKPATKVPCPTPFSTTGEMIPTPETVPARKTSLVQQSKLAANIS